MASSLPTFPRLVFTIIEPISLVAGFIGAVIDPAWFIGEQAPRKDGIGIDNLASDHSIIVTWQLGNLYLLLAFIGIAILSTTTEIKVVRAYLIALLLGDVGHVGFSSYGLGWERITSPAKWNAMAWGNIAMTNFSITSSHVHPSSRHIMNTRSAALRAEQPPANPQPQRVTRSTQQQNQARPISTPRVTRTAQPPPETIKRGLQRYPAARRNAPSYARGSPSIPSEPQRPDDETEFYDETQNGEPVDQFEKSDSHNEELKIVMEANDTRQRILELSVPDLARAADSLLGCIEQRDPDQDVFEGCLSIKRRAFYDIRTEYGGLDEPSTEPFIDWAHFLNDPSSQNQDVMVTQIARTNVVTALDRLYDAQHDAPSEIFPFLQALNEVLPAFFTTSENMFQHPECTLDLRTWLCVETLSHGSDENHIDYRQALASWFCEDMDDVEFNSNQERDHYYAKLFAGEHFKNLGGTADEPGEADKLCSSRIAQIIGIIKTNKKDGGVSRLKMLYPLHKLVADLQAALRGLYKILTYVERESVRGTEPRSPYRTKQDVEGSQVDFGSESQSIVRAGTLEAEPSLFVDQKSIRALQGGGSRAGSAIPPSNQLAGSRSGAPRDYRNHTNADLIGGSPFPPARSYRLVSHGRNAESLGQKRPRSAGGEDGEDPFETDTRNIDPARREELKRRMPPPARPESTPRPPKQVSHPPPLFESDYQASEQDASQDASSQDVPQPPPPSIPNFQAIRQYASQVTKNARMLDSQRQGPRQRVPWSDKDAGVLVNLVGKHLAHWSTMEAQDGKLFEHPRNQQAYRDKARNMKVEYLKTNLPLPPGFDHVVLGKKECDIVKGVGKNPYRSEADIDDEGNPINTELRPPSMESTPF
ncbi:hypothetical protein F66182_5802 [Fusarium sp. NRRL 66182]|nr:hypothetical protein F66182_5802 [Fusarium sp. NRRL 66182]